MSWDASDVAGIVKWMCTFRVRVCIIVRLFHEVLKVEPTRVQNGSNGRRLDRFLLSEHRIDNADGFVDGHKDLTTEMPRIVGSIEVRVSRTRGLAHIRTCNDATSVFQENPVGKDIPNILGKQFLKTLLVMTADLGLNAFAHCDLALVTLSACREQQCFPSSSTEYSSWQPH